MAQAPAMPLADFLNIPINKIFSIGIRVSYYNFSALLKNEQNISLISNGDRLNGAFEHSIDTKLSAIGIEPMLKFLPFDNSNLNFNIGFQLGKLLNKHYSQKEEIIKPQGVGTFLDENGNDSHSRIRNSYSGDLEKAASILFSTFIGVSYQAPLNKSGSLFIEPELNYFLGMSNIINDPIVNKWKANSLRAGIAIKYSPKPAEPIIEKYEKIEIIDTIRIESELISKNEFVFGKPLSNNSMSEKGNIRLNTERISRTDTLKIAKIYALSGDIIAVGVDSANVEIENPIFKIEEYKSNRLDPLLNYIFFENNSTEIPNKYKKLDKNQSQKFDIDSLYRETTIDIYYNLLNIIGRRLIKNPDAKISLIGCNSDIGEEKGNIELSQKRAESIKYYLCENWGILQSRIKIDKRNLPQKASLPKDELDKIAENQRVEIYSDNSDILEPIFIQKIDRLANPQTIRFKTRAISEAGIKSWIVSAFQKSDSASKFTYKGSDKLIANIDWKLESFQNIMPKAVEPIIYRLKLEDMKGNKIVIDNKTLPIETITIQKRKTNRKIILK